MPDAVLIDSCPTVGVVNKPWMAPVAREISKSVAVWANRPRFR
jgi:hypothetical protein